MITAETIVEIIASTGVVKDMSKFDIDKSLYDNGVDSLDSYMVYLAIEEGLGRKFTDDESERFKSVRDMVDALNAH